MDTVPFLGVYTTEVHRFGLVYEYMDGLDLRQHLRNETGIGRMKLVPISFRAFLVLNTNLLMLLDNS